MRGFEVIGSAMCFEGGIGFDNLDALYRAASQSIHGCSGEIIADFSAVKRYNTSLIILILACLRLARQQGVVLVLRGAPPGLETICPSQVVYQQIASLSQIQ